MRICHLIYDDIANPWLGGGGAIRAHEIYRRLASRHQITLITGNFPGARPEEEREGMRLVRVGTDHSYALSRLSYSRGAVGQLRLREWDIWIHDFSAFAPLWASRALRRRGLLFFYHFVGHHAFRKHPFVGGISWLAEALTLRGYSRIVTISPSVQQLVADKLGSRAVGLDCVYTGVGAGYFLLEPEEGNYILYFGRTDVHTKGIDVLLKAFARVGANFPQVRLKFAGRVNRHQRRELEGLIGGTGVGERIEFLGEVDEVEKGQLLRRALFVCMPSRYEGWGIVAVEAAAAAKAVLGTRVSGLVDAVRDGETGLLVDAGDVDQLAQAMGRLLRDRDLRRTLGAQGRIWARRFDWEQIAADQEAVYQRTLEAAL